MAEARTLVTLGLCFALCFGLCFGLCCGLCCGLPPYQAELLVISKALQQGKESSSSAAPFVPQALL